MSLGGMNIGARDRLIVIEQPVFSQSGSGMQTITGFTTFHEAWAQELPFGGTESQQQLHNVATVVKKFKIPFFEGITPIMRIVFNSDNYDILEIQPIGREGLIIKAERKDDR